MKKWQRWAVRGIAITAGCFGLFWSNTSASANSINTYIANQNYATPKITSSIWSTFPKNSYRYNKPEGLWSMKQPTPIPQSIMKLPI
ncbi:hypothetical protein L3X07_13315 [Levilactobacillus brevis]|nr:hypothetical protein [Levilactobacillus brevis]